jgi:hypothetical protein
MAMANRNPLSFSQLELGPPVLSSRTLQSEISTLKKIREIRKLAARSNSNLL